MNKYKLLIPVIITLVLSGCSVLNNLFNKGDSELDQTQSDIQQALDGAYHRIDKAPNEWKAVAIDIINEFESSSSSLITQLTSELQDALLTSGAIIDAGAKCDAKFVGDLVKERIQEFRNALSNESSVKPLPPWVCYLLPVEIEVSVDENNVFQADDLIKIFGYNFNNSNVPKLARIINSDNTKVDTVEVLFVTGYELQVNLQGANVKKIKRGAKIEFEWAASPKSYRNSAVAILLPTPTPRPTLTPTPTPIPKAKVAVTGEMFIFDEDATWIPGVDHDYETFPINESAILEPGRNTRFNISKCVDSEVAVDLRIELVLNNDLSARAEANADIYESDDCFEDYSGNAEMTLFASSDGKSDKESIRVNDTKDGDGYADITLQLSTTRLRSASEIDSKIRDVWVDHNVYQNEQKGMRIHVKFSAYGLKNVPCRAIAYFEFDSGKKLKDFNDRYDTSDGHVSTATRFTPRYTASTYHDLKLFMPYNELHLSEGKHDLRFYISLYDELDKLFFGASKYYYFEVSK